MRSQPDPHLHRRNSLVLSAVIFVLATVLMWYLRLHVFRDRFITLTYGLPLLVCLWHRDRRLLWTMAVTFSAMAYYKAFHVLPDVDPKDSLELLQWVFQVVNIGVAAVAVHAIIQYTGQLHASNIALEQANDELRAQAEELAQQNEEIHRQSEELSQQNEELHQQSEEVQQQNEELQQQGEELETQSEELKTINAEVAEREAMLSSLLKTALGDPDRAGLAEVCDLVLRLVGRSAHCATVAEKNNGELLLRARSGQLALERDRWSFAQSLAAVAIEHGRTVCVHDLAQRPDLIVPRLGGVEMRSSMATPLRVAGTVVGVLEVHSAQPQAWTDRQFQLVEWAAAQCGVMLEITRLRQELADKNAGLEKLVQERTARLQDMVNELQHVSYAMAHDMRAPLRAMHTFANLLSTDSDVALTPDQRKEYSRRIMVAAARLDRLIQDALHYTKLAQQDMTLGTVDLSRLMRELVETYPNLHIDKADILIENELPVVIGNDSLLTQCFSNLLGNAVKFVPPGVRPQIRLRAEIHDGSVRIWVNDNGIGIPQNAQPRLFKMFQKLHSDYEGTGIGLAIVRKVVERLDGKVGVQSEAGTGSRFWVELPLPNGRN